MYWSGFGGVNPGLTRIQLWPFAIVCLASFVGLLALVLRSPLASWQLTVKEGQSLILLLATGVLVWSIVPLRADIYPNRPSMFAFAGVRHVLTVLPTTMTLFTLGFLNVFPNGYHRRTIAVLALLLFLSSIYIMLLVQIPFYDCPYHPKTQCLSTVQ